MKIKQFDRVLLKDGKEGDVMEVLGEQEEFILTVGEANDFKDIVVIIDDIEKVL